MWPCSRISPLHTLHRAVVTRFCSLRRAILEGGLEMSWLVQVLNMPRTFGVEHGAFHAKTSQKAIQRYHTEYIASIQGDVGHQPFLLWQTRRCMSDLIGKEEGQYLQPLLMSQLAWRRSGGDGRGGRERDMFPTL